MRATLPVIILLFTIFQRGFTNEDSANKDGDLESSCDSGHCSVEDEGPCQDDGQQKLYRWDPVKVCLFSLNNLVSQVGMYFNTSKVLFLTRCSKTKLTGLAISKFSPCRFISVQNIELYQIYDQ